MRYIVVAALLLGLSALLPAGILGASGNACVLSSEPPSWAPGALESDTCIFGFYDQPYVGFSFPYPITFNMTPTGFQDYGQPINAGPEVTFAAGSVFDSFMVTFDPIGTDDDGVAAEGEFIFDQQIVLLITSGEMEIYGPVEEGDWSMVSPGRSALFVHFSAGPHVDHLMVITTNDAPIPEPAPSLLFGAALLALARLRKIR